MNANKKARSYFEAKREKGKISNTENTDFGQAYSTGVVRIWR
jgi:hypothetical protein